MRSDTNSWVAAAHAVSVPTPSSAEESTEVSAPRPVFVAAHGGAGSTVWAAMLTGVDGGAVDAWMDEGRHEPVVLVAKASMDGIDAAKAAIQRHGSRCFASVLMIPARPGRLPRILAAELKVLDGAVPTVKAPWLPRLLLKRAGQASPADLSPKDLAVICDGLNLPGTTDEIE